MAIRNGFVDYCLELLSGLGTCTAKRMFGGWGIALVGLTLALIADLGAGDRLWLKTEAQSQGLFEAEGCQRFCMTMVKKGVAVPISMGYYSAPVDAMESTLAMTPWARLALDSARKANLLRRPRRAAKPAGLRKPSDRPPGG